MAKLENVNNRIEIRLKVEIDKEIANLKSKEMNSLPLWNLEKELISAIRSAKEETEILKTNARKPRKRV